MSVAPRRKVALFVDFDNAYSGLRRRSPKAADYFGAQPQAWLKWLEEGMPCSCASEGSLLERSILVRKCYINPKDYGKYRTRFALAGFSVVDCPILTGLGKTGADMLMVLEMMDALDQQLYDEFIIFSGDADFTPMLLRLRARDRRTAVVVTGNYAQVMHGATDRLIKPEIFMQFALKTEESPSVASGAVPKEAVAASPVAPAGSPALAQPGPGGVRTVGQTAKATPDLVPGEKKPAAGADGKQGDEAAIVDFIRERAAALGNPVSLATLGDLVRKQFASVAQTSWFGSNSFGKWLRKYDTLPFRLIEIKGNKYVEVDHPNDPTRGNPRTDATTPHPERGESALGTRHPRTAGKGGPVVLAGTGSEAADANVVEVAEPATPLMGEMGRSAPLEVGTPPSGDPAAPAACEVTEMDPPAYVALDGLVAHNESPELIDFGEVSPPIIAIAATLGRGEFLASTNDSSTPETCAGELVTERTHCTLCEAALRPHHPRCILCGTPVEPVLVRER